MFLIRIILKALIILLLLPQLDLIAFNGGFFWALIAVFLVALASLLTTLLLLPALLASKFFAGITGLILGGSTGAILAGFLVNSVFMAIALALSSLLGSGIVLLGLWPTLLAAAILGVTNQVIATIGRR